VNKDDKLIYEASIKGALRSFGQGATRGWIERAVRLIQQERFDEGWSALEARLKPEHIPAVKKWAESLPRPYAGVKAEKILRDKEWVVWFEQVWQKIEPLLK